MFSVSAYSSLVGGAEAFFATRRFIDGLNAEEREAHAAVAARFAVCERQVELAGAVTADHLASALAAIDAATHDLVLPPHVLAYLEELRAAVGALEPGAPEYCGGTAHGQ